MLTVEGELDDISGSGQTQAAQGLCSSIPAQQKRHLEAKGAGHYGIVSGRRWREVVYPEVKAFILAHQPPAAQAAPSPTPAEAGAKVPAKSLATAAAAVKRAPTRSRRV